MFSTELEKNVETLPDKPGVYSFVDSTGSVLYVGKAQSLRNRVRSYLQPPDTLPAKTRLMLEKAVDVKVTVTSTEVEALILECNLIKEQRPRYNVRLRDDKSYPFIKVTMQEEWPRVYFTRGLVKDGSRYFGPFTDAKSVRHTLDTLNRLFSFRTCHRTITGRDSRACLAYHIHRCTAPCIGAADRGSYLQAIQQVVLFLEGKQERIIEELRREMEQAAEDLRFEQAARLRDRIRALEKMVDRQKVDSGEDRVDRDVVGIACGNGMACAQLFFVRNGKLVGSEHFALEGTEDEEAAPVLASFIQQFYDSAAHIPPEILLQEEVENAATLSRWLAERRGGKVHLKAPRRGQERQLVRLAVENAAQQLEMMKLRWLNDTQRTTAALVELRDVLQLPSTPHRIECYDISNILGTSAVGSMVVFEGGQPKTSEYRRFKIKTVEGTNDYAMLQEVLRRRFKRATSPDWATLPDLVMVDGGKGQLNSALEVLDDLGLAHLPAIGLAKENEVIFQPGSSDGLALPGTSQALHLVQRIRDEAHRFAVTYHRKVRTKRGFSSVLDEIPGIGPRRKRALLKHFGSVKAIREATLEELLAIPGMNRRAAESIKDLMGG